MWRWAVLTAISVAMFGNYYAYDSIGPVADSLQRILGYTDTQIGTLNAIYSFPNIVMVLVGGVIVDRYGAARATLAFAAIQGIGALVTALSPLFPVMAAGRLIFGLGAESMIVAITVAIGQWFVGRQLGFAFGLNLSFARLGSYGADMSTTWFKPLYDRGWQPPLWLATGFAATCVAGAAVYYLLDRSARARFTLSEASQADRIVWSDLWRFDRSYWYIVGLCVTFYSVIFPFRSTFAIKYFQHAHGLSLQEAGSMNAYVFLAAIFATPTFGLHRRSRRPARGLHGRRHTPALCGFPDPWLHEHKPLGVDGHDRHRLLARARRAVAGRAVHRDAEPSRHGLRPDDDAPEYRDDAGEPRGRCIERCQRRRAGQSGWLSPHVVDVLPAQPLRLRIRRGASHP